MALDLDNGADLELVFMAYLKITHFTISRVAGKCFTLYDAIKALLPELFAEEPVIDADKMDEAEEEGPQKLEVDSSSRTPEETGEALNKRIGLLPDGAEIQLIRIQGIEPKFEIPFGWVVNNLMNPEYCLHICVYVKTF